MGCRFGEKARLGWNVLICVDSFRCGDRVAIRRGTSFTGPFSVEIGNDTLIGLGNRFDCGDGAARPSVAAKGYARRLVIGNDCLVHEDHLFDVYGLISIGDRTWVAGFASQFLTHGASTVDRDITIGSGCYLGSALRFAPGSGVGDKVIVAMGAVVTRRIEGDDIVVGGVPARVIRARAGRRLPVREGLVTFRGP